MSASLQSESSSISVAAKSTVFQKATEPTPVDRFAGFKQEAVPISTLNKFEPLT